MIRLHGFTWPIYSDAQSCLLKDVKYFEGAKNQQTAKPSERHLPITLSSDLFIIAGDATLSLLNCSSEDQKEKKISNEK